MNKTVLYKIAIVAALMIAIGVVIYAKRENSTEPNIEATSVEPVSDVVEPDPVEETAPTASATQMLPKMIDLGADKCVPCIMMAPILKELKEEYKGRLDVEFIDVWKNPDAARYYRIDVIPTQIFFDASGQELSRHIGFMDKESIIGKWKDLGVQFEDQLMESK